MDITTIIGPWLSLLLILIPLIYAERWIHQHAYGIGYLLTREKGTATGFYYIVFFPAVFLHEFIQYLMAGVLNVRIKKIHAQPKIQDNGTLRFDFVVIDKTDKIRASVIGGTPFLVAAFLVYFISTSILDLHTIPEALASGHLTNLTTAIRGQFNTPDFWFWLYMLFAISNGMIPTKEDRAGWGLIVGAIGAVTLIFLVIGADRVIWETLAGPVTDGLQLVTTSLAIILGLDILVILLLGITEDTLERVKGFKMDYSGPKRNPKAYIDKRQPGSNVPIPKGELMPSIYNMELPIPNFPDRPNPVVMRQRAAAQVTPEEE